MSNAVNPIPEGYVGAVPYICVRAAPEAIDFYRRAFGAVETERIDQPDGRVGHAEVRIGAATIMLADEFPEMDVLSPRALGGTPVTIHLYVENVDFFAVRAIAEGLEVLRPVATQFYGDRGGKFEDPFGHRWWIATHVEDVSHEEMNRRAAALFGSKRALARFPTGRNRPVDKNSRQINILEHVLAEKVVQLFRNML